MQISQDVYEKTVIFSDGQQIFDDNGEMFIIFVGKNDATIMSQERYLAASTARKLIYGK